MPLANSQIARRQSRVGLLVTRNTLLKRISGEPGREKWSNQQIKQSAESKPARGTAHIQSLRTWCRRDKHPATAPLGATNMQDSILVTSHTALGIPQSHGRTQLYRSYRPRAGSRHYTPPSPQAQVLLWYGQGDVVHNGVRGETEAVHAALGATNIQPVFSRLPMATPPAWHSHNPHMHGHTQLYRSS